MGRISILADSKIVTYLSSPTRKRVRIISSRGEAIDAFERLCRDARFLFFIVTKQVLEWIEPTLSKISRERAYPPMVSVNSRWGPRATANMLAKLIKRILTIET